MNNILTNFIKQILSEAKLDRKKIQIKDLKKYMSKNDVEVPEYFIHFGDSMKVGINPGAPYFQFLGVWAYPWNQRTLADFQNKNIHFTDRRYVFVLKSKLVPHSDLFVVDDAKNPHSKSSEKIIELIK